MNCEEMSRYYQALRETDVLFSASFPFILVAMNSIIIFNIICHTRFWCAHFPNTYAISLIIPISEQYLLEPRLRECVEKAISQYNIENVVYFYSTFISFLSPIKRLLIMTRYKLWVCEKFLRKLPNLLLKISYYD